MSRLPLPKPETMSAEQRRVHEAIRSGPRGSVGGPFPVLLLSPEVADPLQRLGAYLRFGSPLPARARELATLIASRHWTCQFEWHAHAPLAHAAGVPPALVAAIRERKAPAFDDPADRAVYEFATELLERGTVGDGAYGAALRILGAAGVVELVALLGFYTTIAMTLNAHQVPMPAGVAPPLAP
jgi:4-carboxymuconolactone decarboxylase